MMKAFRRIIAIAICFSLAAVSVSAAEAKKPEGVSNTVRVIDGIFEVIDNWILKFSLRQNYKDCTQLCDIPGLDDGYIPQGFCYIDDLDYYAVSAYKDGENSVIFIIDAKTGKEIKKVKLLYEDGSVCQSHAGGVADIGGYLFVSTSKSVRRVKVSDIIAAENNSEVKFCGKINTHMQASSVCAYGNYLFVGKYYSFTFDGTYDSDPSQWVKTPDSKRCYSLCEAFDLSDMEKVVDSDNPVPVVVLTLPMTTQGIAYDGKYFYTSSSSSYIGYSLLRKYSLENFSTDYCIDIADNEVPLVFLTNDRLEKTTKLPPMIEGIDVCRGKPCGIFESGAPKFKFVSLRTPYICSFD